jgi:2-succinyl-5-enolpyruvyl-6-hydroxy-3-cyclohexene-1-carboxylate synthase
MRLLLINNGGGVEFELKFHIGAQFEEQTGDFIAAAGHFGNKSPMLVKHIAEDLGFRYLSASTKDAFLQGVQEFTAGNAQDKPILFECFTNAPEEDSALAAMSRIDTTPTVQTFAGSVAGKVLAQGIKGAVSLARTVLPQGVKASIRKALE